MIVNVGDMLEIWTGGYFTSTPHKVIDNSGQHRFSFPYFAVPRFDVSVSPLHNKNEFDRGPMQVGEVSKQIWHSNWPNADAVEQVIDPYIA